jgi:endonuclease/exonuclease/phosphatase family metal-dependent hydrolase
VIHSLPLPKPIYKKGERRVSIFSKYTIVGELKTFREDTSKCVKVQTPFGDLAVYGTIIGIEGNRRQSFMEDLELQLLDIGNIAASNHVCFAGDLNINFADNFYFTEAGRNKLIASFDEHDLVNLTATVKDNIDHIVLSKSFVGEKKVITEIWNRPINKSLSDHIGVSITLS